MAPPRPAGTRPGSSSTRPPRRPRRRTEILRRAARLFLERGFEIVSRADVARACEISKAGLYYHSRSRQELLAAIISCAQDLHEEEVRKVLSASSGDHADDLRRVIHSHALMMTQGDDAAFAILAVHELRSLLPADHAQIALRKRSYLGVLRERRGSGQKGHRARSAPRRVTPRGVRPCRAAQPYRPGRRGAGGVGGRSQDPAGDEVMQPPRPGAFGVLVCQVAIRQSNGVVVTSQILLEVVS